MNLFSFHKDNLDEVVFENRNKQYGAYAMRKSYDSNLLKASASSFGVLLLLVGAVQIVSLFRKEVIAPIVSDINHDVIETVLTNFKIELDPPSGGVAGIKNENTEVFRIVRDREVTPKKRPLPPDDPDVPYNPTGLENGATAVVGGEGTGTGTATGIAGSGNSIAEPEIQEVFETYLPEMPSFPGGIEAMSQFLTNKTIYPTLARDNGVQGKVVLSFVVMPDGSVGHLKIIKGIGFGCDAEALRVMQLMPKWNPGKQNGKAKAVQMTLPIFFKLE